MLLKCLPSPEECLNWAIPISADKDGGNECIELLRTSLKVLKEVRDHEENVAGEYMGVQWATAQQAAGAACDLCWKALHRGDWKSVNGEASSHPAQAFAHVACWRRACHSQNRGRD